VNQDIQLYKTVGFPVDVSTKQATLEK
jgi:hypothetical protein